MRGLPPHAPGMRIGLYGGSFNPAHAAHLMVSRTALRRLRLDRVWWLISPGNPLKDNGLLPPAADRLATARALIRDPRIVPTTLEADLGTRYTVDTLRALRRRCPGVRFVFLMGGDNLAGFSRWRAWRDIAATVPFAVIDRPGTTHTGVRGKAATFLARRRVNEADAAVLADRPAPAWTLLHGPRSHLSSTLIRGQRGSLE